MALNKSSNPIQTLRQFYEAAEEFGRRSMPLNITAGFLFFSPSILKHMSQQIPMHHLETAAGISSLVGLTAVSIVLVRSASLATSRVAREATSFTRDHILQIPKDIAQLAVVKVLSGFLLGSAAEMALNITVTSARGLEAPDPIGVALGAMALGLSYFVREYALSVIDTNEMKQVCTRSIHALSDIDLGLSLIRRAAPQP